MARLLILYFSRTGNTAKMAQAVDEGARFVGGVEVVLTSEAKPESLSSYDGIIVGTATYHHDMPLGLKLFLEDLAVKNVSLKDKIGTAFGSYGWSGEAPRLVLEIMKNRFEMDLAESPILVRYTPDEAVLQKCRDLGKRVAERLIHKS